MPRTSGPAPHRWEAVDDALGRRRPRSGTRRLSGRCRAAPRPRPCTGRRRNPPRRHRCVPSGAIGHAARRGEPGYDSLDGRLLGGCRRRQGSRQRRSAERSRSIDFSSVVLLVWVAAMLAPRPWTMGVPRVPWAIPPPRARLTFLAGIGAAVQAVPSRRRARVSTSSSIRTVSRPVNVFCWLGW